MSPNALSLITRLHQIRDDAGTPYALFGTIKPEYTPLAEELVQSGYLTKRTRAPTDQFDLYETTAKALPSA